MDTTTEYGITRTPGGPVEPVASLAMAERLVANDPESRTLLSREVTEWKAV
jgi:hypothetical protein